jgi:tetratricopeptide (TPR) repeat protein
MEGIEKTLFISYRRTNVAWALAIFQNLTQHGYDVFFDYKGIGSGDFERVILAHIKARAHFLVLLTPSALEDCDKPGDWLRREIDAALANRRNIVPLMLEGFGFDTPSIAGKLNGSLAALKHYNGLRIQPDYFDEGMERLRSTYLNVPLAAVLHPLSPSAQQAAAEQKAAANAAPAVEEKELTAQQWFERGKYWVMLGFYGRRDEQRDEQLRCYDEAIRLKPDYVDALMARAETRRPVDAARALEDWNEVIRLRPYSVPAFIGRAQVRRDMGDFKGAAHDEFVAERIRSGRWPYVTPLEQFPEIKIDKT